MTHTSSPLVAVNGYWILGLLAGPLALTLIGWWANRARLGGSRIGRRVLTGSVLLLGALCLVSIASVGLLVLPGVILLAVAGTRPPVPAH